jgi:hypothetical protein
MAGSSLPMGCYGKLMGRYSLQQLSFISVLLDKDLPFCNGNGAEFLV